MDPTGTDGCSHIVIQPANEVIAYILGILFHVLLGRCVLVDNFDRIRNSYLFKGFVPEQNPLLDPASIANRSRVFDVKLDRLNGRRNLQRRVALLQMPAIDVMYVDFIFLVLAIIRIGCSEVANALVGNTRLVSRVLRDLTDRIVECLQTTAAIGQFEGQFDIQWKRFRLDYLGQARVAATSIAAKKDRSVGNQQLIAIDDWSTAR